MVLYTWYCLVTLAGWSIFMFSTFDSSHDLCARELSRSDSCHSDFSLRVIYTGRFPKGNLGAVEGGSYGEQKKD